MPRLLHPLALLAATLSSSDSLALESPSPTRELAADRPDTTESPISLEPGRIQLESSLWSYTEIQDSSGRFESWSVGEINIKLGLTRRSDLQLVVAPYIYERESANLHVREAEGFGDLEVRFKWNLWGNDSGDTAAALLPYLKIPSGTAVSNGEWEGGLIAPFACELSERWSFGCQVQIDRAFDEDEGHHWSLGHTAVLGFSITGRLGCFIEYAGSASDLPYQAYASGGVTFRIHDNLQLDFGGLAGLNRDSDDFTVFQGLTLRF